MPEPIQRVSQLLKCACLQGASKHSSSMHCELGKCMLTGPTTRSSLVRQNSQSEGWGAPLSWHPAGPHALSLQAWSALQGLASSACGFHWPETCPGSPPRMPCSRCAHAHPTAPPALRLRLHTCTVQSGRCQCHEVRPCCKRHSCAREGWDESHLPRCQWQPTQTHLHRLMWALHLPEALRCPVPACRPWPLQVTPKAFR